MFTLTVQLSLWHCSHHFALASCVIIRSFNINTVIGCLLVLTTRCLCSRQGQLPVARPQHPRSQGASGDPAQAAAPESRPGRRARADPRRDESDQLQGQSSPPAGVVRVSLPRTERRTP